MAGEETSPRSDVGAASPKSKSKSPSKSPPSRQSPPAEGAPLHSAQHWADLVEENAEGEDDADSAVGSDAGSSTASMSSSILEYRTINGRTFHSERGNAQYWASNDEQQNESMDIVHHFLLLLLDNKLFLSPLKKDIGKAVDIGTGTGIWAIDFADEFPSTEVIATDISPIQPSWVPPNLKFEIDDCTQEWSFKPDSLDFIHMRYLYGSISDWPALFQGAYKACKPGGWIESYEASAMMESDDGSVTETSAMHEWGKFFIEGGKKMGRTFTILEDDVQQKGMEEAGFVNIQVKNLKVPIGSWPQDSKLKAIGQYVQAALEQDYEGYVLFMASQLLGWTKEEVTVYCAQLRREIRSGNYHPFYRQRIVYAQKPEAK